MINRYIREPKMQSAYDQMLDEKDDDYCPFCDLSNIQDRILAEGLYSKVISNAYPYSDTKHQILIIPNRHVPGLEDLWADEIAELAELESLWIRKYRGEGPIETLCRAVSDTNRSVQYHVHKHLIVWR